MNCVRFVEIVYERNALGFARWERRLVVNEDSYAVMTNGWRFVGWRHKPSACTYDEGWMPTIKARFS